MAKRLIDGDKAQAVLMNIAEHLAEVGNTELAGALGAAVEIIGKQRTVPAVEVIHCRDCKHYDNPICEVHSEWPDQYNTGHTAYMEPDDFCSYGERKEG